MVRLTLDIPARLLDMEAEVGEACAVVWLWEVGWWGGDEVPLVLSGELLLTTPDSEIETGMNIGFIVLSTCNNKPCICQSQ